jgi:nucleotide-binding universal stress UspA family protein
MNGTPTAPTESNSDARSTAAGTIVVGVDGSEASRDALRWAYRQAELTGSQLRALMSWEVPTTAYWFPFPEGLDFQKGTEEALAKTLQETLGDKPVMPLTPVVVEGNPAAVLIRESGAADLLVVGSRGHGEFTGMLLGSVSEHCVAQADCPVVVVRGKPAPG